MSSWPIRLRRFAGRGRAAVAVAALLSSCASSLREPTTADAERLRASYGDVSLGELSKGRDRYVARCAGCHALKDPGHVAPERWRAEVRQMREKFGVVLEPAEGEAIVRYLEAMSSRGTR
ncbi:MAG TPA: cytochrome c [Polyangiaceae bacterium]|nr:cytochrome c [Polyangiaceae bacterium]